MGTLAFTAIDLGSALLGFLGASVAPKIFGGAKTASSDWKSHLLGKVSAVRAAIAEFKPASTFESAIAGGCGHLASCGESFANAV